MPSLLDISTHLLKGQPPAAFAFSPSTPIPGGRITIYEAPNLRDAGFDAVIGSDHALGIDGRDYDTAVVWSADGGPTRQLAEAQGHWGETFDRVLFALCMYFGGAYLVPERNNTGLAVIRSLVSNFGYTRIYREREERKGSRPGTQRLGYQRSDALGDIAVFKLRQAVHQRSVLVRSRQLLEQMSRYQFRPKASVENHEALDADMTMRLAGGGSPDLIIAAAMGLHGLSEVPPRDRPAAAPKPGTGAALFPEMVKQLNGESAGAAQPFTRGFGRKE